MRSWWLPLVGLGSGCVFWHLGSEGDASEGGGGTSSAGAAPAGPSGGSGAGANAPGGGPSAGADPGAGGVGGSGGAVQILTLEREDSVVDLAHIGTGNDGYVAVVLGSKRLLTRETAHPAWADPPQADNYEFVGSATTVGFLGGLGPDCALAGRDPLLCKRQEGKAECVANPDMSPFLHLGSVDPLVGDLSSGRVWWGINSRLYRGSREQFFAATGTELANANGTAAHRLALGATRGYFVDPAATAIVSVPYKWGETAQTYNTQDLGISTDLLDSGIWFLTTAPRRDAAFFLAWQLITDNNESCGLRILANGEVKFGPNVDCSFVGHVALHDQYILTGDANGLAAYARDELSTETSPTPLGGLSIEAIVPTDGDFVFFAGRRNGSAFVGRWDTRQALDLPPAP
jgi:hypothetical protein